MFSVAATANTGVAFTQVPVAEGVQASTINHTQDYYDYYYYYY